MLITFISVMIASQLGPMLKQMIEPRFK